MNDDELLLECKKGLDISSFTTILDGVLKQKLLAVKTFMINAGVSEAAMGNDLAVGIITMGVADLWQLEGGDVKFSPLFYTLLSQLVLKSKADLYSFRLNYDGNGNTGGGVPKDQKIYSQGDKAVVLGNLGELTKVGYTFGGWNTKTDGSGTTYNSGSTISIGVSSLTLYVKWVAS